MKTTTKIWSAFSVIYNNYFPRGSSKILQLVTFLMMLATLVTVYFGTSYTLMYVAFFGSIAIIISIIVGYLDYGVRGTRLRETKKYWESDFGIMPALIELRLMKKLIDAQNEVMRKEGLPEISLDEHEKDMLVWSEKTAEKNKFYEMISEDLR